MKKNSVDIKANSIHSISQVFRVNMSRVGWKKDLNLLKHHYRILLKLVDFDNRYVLSIDERSNLDSIEDAFEAMNSHGKFVGIRCSFHEYSGIIETLINILAHTSFIFCFLHIIGFNQIEKGEDLLDQFITSKFFNFSFPNLNPLKNSFN